MTHAHLNQKWMSLWAASVLVKISFEEDVGGLVKVKAGDTGKLNTFGLLQIETGRASYKILDT